MNPTITFILAYSLLALATLLFLWALCWDWLMLRLNRRPNRRCPKCWYNLTYTPSKTCSECGYTTDNENKLHKSRKRKRWAVLAILIFFAAQITFIFPRYQKRGWIGAIPNWTLIALLPQLDIDFNIFTPWWLQQNSLTSWTWRNKLWVELNERSYQQEDMDYIDKKLLIWRCMRGDEKRPPCSSRWNAVYGQLLGWVIDKRQISLEPFAAFAIQNATVNIRVPKRWPADMNVPIYINPELWYSTSQVITRWDIDLEPKIYGFYPDDKDSNLNADQFTSITYKMVPQSYISRFPFWKNDKHGNLTFTTTINDATGKKQSEIKRTIPLILPAPKPTPWQEIISPVKSESLNNLIRTKVKAKIRPTRGGMPIPSPYWFQIDFTGLRQYFMDNNGPTLGLTIDILHGNKIVLTGHGWIWTASPETLKTLPKPAFTNLIIEPGFAFRTYDPFANINFNTPATWQARLTPNPIAALENLNCNQYWQGEPITIPLSFTK